MPDSETVKFEGERHRLRNEWIVARNFRVSASKVFLEWNNVSQRTLKVTAIRAQESVSMPAYKVSFGFLQLYVTDVAFV